MNIIPFFMMYFFVYETISLSDIDEYRIIFKALSSFCFLICAVLSYRKSKSTKKYSYLIISGLFFCLLGDIIITHPISNALILGASAFAVGHILFIIAFSSFSCIHLKDIIITSFITAAFTFFITHNPDFHLENKLSISCIYCFIISFMMIKSLYLFKLRKINSFFTYFTILGASLFFISDCVLSFDIFLINAPKYINAINLILYYSGQGILALSLSDTQLSSSN